jgi:hypothetical protein
MTRQLLNVLTALSLLVCAAVLVLWVRSYGTTDRFDYQATTKLYSVLIHMGTFQVAQVDRDSGSVSVGFYHHGASVRASATWWNDWHKPVTTRGMFHFGLVRGTYYRVLILPLWIALAAAAVPPILRVRLKLRSHARERLGLCSTCGYDLTGNISGVCPECGYVAAP